MIFPNFRKLLSGFYSVVDTPSLGIYVSDWIVDLILNNSFVGVWIFTIYCVCQYFRISSNISIISQARWILRWLLWDRQMIFWTVIKGPKIESYRFQSGISIGTRSSEYNLYPLPLSLPLFTISGGGDSVGTIKYCFHFQYNQPNLIPLDWFKTGPKINGSLIRKEQKWCSDWIVSFDRFF